MMGAVARAVSIARPPKCARIPRMNRLALLTIVLTIAGCGTPPNEVVPLRDGTFRARMYDQAIVYCQKDGLTASMLGKAPAESGVLFSCK
ncbi:MAG: hypothetical protein JWQ73_4233 [Variovorax sp.]|nr:hypothetical protein [Variovorax sp.]